MATPAQVLAIDGVEDKKVKRCTHCGRDKARDEFTPVPSRKGGLHSWCRLCVRIDHYERRQTEQGRAVDRAYRLRPEQKEYHREYLRAWRAAHPGAKAAYDREYRRSPGGKFARARSNARRELATTADDARRARLEAVIASCDDGIARIKAAREAERGPSRPRSAYGSRSPCRGVRLTAEGTFRVEVRAGKGETAHGGTFGTLDEARAMVNRLGEERLGVANYADRPARGKAS